MSGALLLAAGVLLQAAAAPAPAAQAVVVAAVENMYATPDESAEVVSQATLGQVVDVLQTRGTFARVRTPDLYEGWLARAAVSAYADRASPRYARTGRVVEVTSLVAYLYRDADVETARPLTSAPLATWLEVAADGPDEDWLTVRLPAGDTAYVQAGDVTPVDPTAPRRRGSPEEVLATARRFLGVPYLWGGMTARGLDCSGLVSRVYQANGLVLPRDADLQFGSPVLVPVDRGDLRPADLVFFGRGPKAITHVGLYVGDGRFLSATIHGVPAVHEDRLDDPHWASAYQGARRPR
jgi:gamma-D-glutamyl-L-lysine dipeptidyl-peptidase